MNARVDLSGFHYSTARVQEVIEEFLEELLGRHPDVHDIDIEIRRSFFGTYSAHVRASLNEDVLETCLKNTDPEECYEECFERFSRSVEAWKSKRTFTTQLTM